MNKVKVLTVSQIEAKKAEIIAEKNVFLQSAVKALKNGVSVKRILSQLGDFGFKILANPQCGTIRIGDNGFAKREEGEKEVNFHDLHTTREYCIYMLSHGYNVSFNDWED